MPVDLLSESFDKTPGDRLQYSLATLITPCARTMRKECI